MAPKLDDVLPQAKDFMEKLALAAAEGAAKAARQHEKPKPKSEYCSRNLRAFRRGAD